jgi:hypothetical protein
MRRKEFDNTKISFTLTKAGHCEGAPVELTVKELAELPRMIAGKKFGPKTKPQAEVAALFKEVVRRGLRGE